MSNPDPLAQPAATIAAELIRRIPSELDVTPSQAAAMFNEVLAALKVLPGLLPPAPKSGVHP